MALLMNLAQFASIALPALTIAAIFCYSRRLGAADRENNPFGIPRSSPKANQGPSPRPSPITCGRATAGRRSCGGRLPQTAAGPFSSGRQRT